MAPMAKTTSNSSSVNPRWSRMTGRRLRLKMPLRLIADVGVFTFAARLTVSPQRDDFNATVFYGALELVRLTPRIVGYATLEVGTIPAVQALGADIQGCKAFFGIGEATDIQLE